MVMPAVRDAGSSLAVTEKRTDPSPCPSEGCATVTHDASVFTAHWQSRVVPMRIDPDPPAAGKDGPSAVACTVHLVGDGPVRVSVLDDDPHADPESVAATSTAAREEPGELTVATDPGDRVGGRRARLRGDAPR